MNKIKLNVLGLSYSQTQSSAYALVLAEENGDRRIPIIIGNNEAQAIAVQMENMTPSRPLTHDFIRLLTDSFQIEVLEVNIIKLREGIFFAEVLLQRENTRVRIDSRTSDAVALAMRCNCPIFTTEEIMEKAGIIIKHEEEEEKSNREEKNKEETETSESVFSSYTLAQLEMMLSEAIQEENYERASVIRDELENRKK